MEKSICGVLMRTTAPSSDEALSCALASPEMGEDGAGVDGAELLGLYLGEADFSKGKRHPA